MNKIKNYFSIKDLENLSGIKAHTIRIWESRYNLLQPMRSDTNIRTYDMQNFQKLLNVVFLQEYGYKISRIARLTPTEIEQTIREISSTKMQNTNAIQNLKVAMMSFDQQLFQQNYSALLEHKSFREIFFEVFIPLLNEVGLLWQTNTILPTHEHFISNLIAQKLHINIEKLQLLPTKTNEPTYVLFLPENEIHNLGLLYVQYELMLKGLKTIYLGESIPNDNLLPFIQSENLFVLISYFTVFNDLQRYQDFIAFINENLPNSNALLYLFGANSRKLQFSTQTQTKINYFDNLQIFVKNIK